MDADGSRARREPTHAGGVVHRVRAGVVEVLLVTARKHRENWVLPKGHVEAGEAPEQTALREVAEEAGVVAEIVRFLDDVDLGATDARGPKRIRFYLMRAVRQEASHEGRDLLWLPADRAAQTASADWVRGLIRAAVAPLAAPPS
jgi:8-oxo-dGTP pyrophosphatase MutT (NUDIX family)